MNERVVTEEKIMLNRVGIVAVSMFAESRAALWKGLSSFRKII